MKNQFLTLLVILAMFTVMTQAQNKIEVNSLKAHELILKNNKIIILDVRTPDEFLHGHVDKAININVLEADAISKILKLDKTKTYLVYCRTHHRSDNAVNYMLQHGFKNIYQMIDGFNGWMMNKLPEKK